MVQKRISRRPSVKNRRELPMGTEVPTTRRKFRRGREQPAESPGLLLPYAVAVAACYVLDVDVGAAGADGDAVVVCGDRQIDRAQTRSVDGSY